MQDRAKGFSRLVRLSSAFALLIALATGGCGDGVTTADSTDSTGIMLTTTTAPKFSTAPSDLPSVTRSTKTGDSNMRTTTAAPGPASTTTVITDAPQATTTVPPITTTGGPTSTTARPTTTAAPTTTARPTTTAAPTTTTAKGPTALIIQGPSGIRELSMAELKAMPATEGYGGWKNQLENITAPTPWKGVSLRALMDLVGGSGSVTVVASDGYGATLSADQAGGSVNTYDAATGQATSGVAVKVIIAYAKGGAALSSGEGPLRLAFVTSENNQVTDSDMWVKKVVELRVN